MSFGIQNFEVRRSKNWAYIMRFEEKGKESSYWKCVFAHEDGGVRICIAAAQIYVWCEGLHVCIDF
jgi:hypothetical protein